MATTKQRVPFGDLSNKENAFPEGVAMKKKEPVPAADLDFENEFQQVRVYFFWQQRCHSRACLYSLSLSLSLSLPFPRLPNDANPDGV